MKTINWKEIAIVSGCGAVGGLLAWLIAAVSAGVSGPWSLELCLAILGGAVAAGAGVYLLANTDTSNGPRCIFFSIFCGVCWQPIIETGKRLVTDAPANSALVAAKDQVDQSLAQQPSGGTRTDIAPIVAGVEKLADKLPAATKPDIRREALQSLDKAMIEIRKFGEKMPDQAVTALESIGKRAIASDSTAAKLSAKDALQGIRDGSHSPETWNRANKAIEALR